MLHPAHRIVCPWAALVMWLGLAACDSSTTPPSSCWTTLDDDAVRDTERVAWVTVGEPAVDDSGLAEAVDVALTPDTPWVAVRVSEPLGGPVCAQLDEVLDPDAGAWVTPPASLDDYRSYCRSCPERVSVGVGSGSYVLPSGDPPPPQAERLVVRAAVRECSTFLAATPGDAVPERLRVEALALPRIDDARAGTVLLEVVITSGSIFHDDAEAMPPGIDAALARVDELLAPAGLGVRAVRVRRVEVEDPLAIERGDHAALDRLHADAHACDPDGVAPDDRWVPVVLAGCIEVSDPVQMRSDEPNGFVPRIPDGLPPHGRAHGVFIRGRDCRDGGPMIDWAPESLGKLIAHELGHYLGLYHTVEPDGGVDTLDDTGEDNLMHWSSLTETLSAGQVRVMRRHPAIVWQ